MSFTQSVCSSMHTTHDLQVFHSIGEAANAVIHLDLFSRFFSGRLLQPWHSTQQSGAAQGVVRAPARLSVSGTTGVSGRPELRWIRFQVVFADLFLHHFQCPIAREACTKSCGSGITERLRNVSIPAAHGGEDCMGPCPSTLQCGVTDLKVLPWTCLVWLVWPVRCRGSTRDVKKCARNPCPQDCRSRLSTAFEDRTKMINTSFPTSLCRIMWAGFNNQVLGDLMKWIYWWKFWSICHGCAWLCCVVYIRRAMTNTICRFDPICWVEDLTHIQLWGSLRQSEVS